MLDSAAAVGQDAVINDDLCGVHVHRVSPTGHNPYSFVCALNRRHSGDHLAQRNLICVKLTYTSASLKGDLWLHRTRPEDVRTNAELHRAPFTLLGEKAKLRKIHRLTSICVRCKRDIRAVS